MTTISKCSFVMESFKSLTSKLISYGNEPSEKDKESLKHLLEAYFDGISDVLNPSFFLNSLPPGSGKTEAISVFVKVWKSKAFLPDGGILIALKTLDEIKALIHRLGLGPEDFGCVTRDDAINGLGRADTDNAPVLITTQQMLISRSHDRSFARAADFHYKGRARALRIWDEAFDLAEPASITLYAIEALPNRLHLHFPALVQQLNVLSGLIRKADPGHLIRVPSSLKDDLRSVRSLADAGKLKLRTDELAAVNALYLTKGKDVRVIATGGVGGKALVGAGHHLPSDLAPMVITDASGRVRTTYDVMSAARGNLVYMPSAEPDYRNMHIHLWETAVGKEALGDKDKAWSIYRRIARQMQEAGDEWLVISFKGSDDPDGVNVEAALQEAVDGKAKFAFLNWGKHHGINTHKHVKNIVVIGSYFYAAHAYEALGIAASGLPVSDAPDVDRSAVKAGEYKHNMLQAVLRGNARNSVKGVAGECNVYVVASPKNSAAKLLAEAFPGAVIAKWGVSDAKPVAGNEMAVLRAVEELMTPNVSEVRKKAVRERAGITSKEMNRQLARPAIQLKLRSLGIVSQGQKLVRSK